MPRSEVTFSSQSSGTASTTTENLARLLQAALTGEDPRVLLDLCSGCTAHAAKPKTSGVEHVQHHPVWGH